MRTTWIRIACRLAWILTLPVRAQEDGEVVGRGGFAEFRQPSPAALIAERMLVDGDRDADGALSRAEFASLGKAWFERLDPAGEGRLTREEFLERIEGLMPPPPVFGRAGERGPSRFFASRFFGFFVALDANVDGGLDRGEWQERFGRWFADWASSADAGLDQARLAQGLASVLPRTNLGDSAGRDAQDPVPGLPNPPPSPVLPPGEALGTLRLPPGFRAELAASEPLVEDPIALSFDPDGRLYVAEMRAFMLDVDGSDERAPIGRISLLEDADRDGRFDRAHRFLEGLIAPRALLAIRGGLLYVADAKLFWARDSDGDGRADINELVDPAYGGGNVEHAPNGLMASLDNWIYNARSGFRYRWLGGVLVKQSTENRGQWGMTQDNYGRLFYNVNNSQLLGDFTPPNYMNRNPHYSSSAGLNLIVAADQRVFTIRMNTAVNRAYAADVLDPSGRLYVFASSCGPVIYRGDNFPQEFVGNAFVCDPAANIIKRNLVFDQDLTLTSRFAYDDREFLASTDERFRPVNAFNGPDGALWVVDMYRGISQYHLFMTRYLRRETLERGLDKGVHYGRIYRIVSTAKTAAPSLQLSAESSLALVERLSHPNGWVRDAAQRLLIERADRSATAALLRLAREGLDPLGRIHALWTLEGLFLDLPAEAATAAALPRWSTPVLRQIQPDFAWDAAGAEAAVQACLTAGGAADPKVQCAAIRVAESLAGSVAGRQAALLRQIEALAARARPEVLFQIALTAGNMARPDVFPLLSSIAAREAGRQLVRDAVVTGLRGWELQFVQYLLADPRWDEQRPGRASVLQGLASAVMREREPVKSELLLTLAADSPSASSWKQKSLLAGMAAIADGRRRPAMPISLSSRPRALDALVNSEDHSTRELGGKIGSLFTWPGDPKQNVSAVAPPSGPTASPGESARIEEGKALYQQICAGCHGLDGEGVRPLAPPLVDSEWVLGPTGRLARIILHGMSGPVQVAGTAYQPPDILPEMPGLAALNDAQIAAVLTYIRTDWGHRGPAIATDEIARARAETQDRAAPWSEAELTRGE